MASNIPKFASFRPKPKEPSPEEKIKSSESRDKHDKHNKRERRERHERPEKATQDKIPKHVPEPTSHEPARQLPTSFFVDRKGDPATLKYGSLDSYKTPPYRRYGYGYVLGLPTYYKIDRDQSSDKKIVLSGPSSQRHERPLASRRLPNESDRALRFVKATPSLEPATAADFIQLSGPRKRKRDFDLEQNEVDYRSIEKQRDESPLDSELESESGTELDQAASEITQRNSALIQRTRERPQDVQAWLDLVDHQEAMMLLGRSSAYLSTSDRRNLADVRISTYEQAIKKVGNDRHSQIQLHLGLLNEALRSWDGAKLERKWSEVLSSYASSPELWMKYLDFVQSRFIDFKYENCRACFQRCLKTLQPSSPAVSPEVYLYVLLRLTTMIRDSGYQELAFAIWQALLEFHLMPPQTEGTTGSRREYLQLFEEFWENEAPRIGEPDSKGWRNTNADDSTLPQEDPPTLLEPVRSVSMFDDFQIREHDHIDKLRYPGRATDELGAEDPFHMILFSDVEQYLNVLPSETPGIPIIDAFLCFSGMPPLPGLDQSRRKWWLDPFLQTRPITQDTIDIGGNTFPEALRAFRHCPNNFQMTLELLFDEGFPAVTEGIEVPSGISSADLLFIRRVLRLLTTDNQNAEAVGEYLLAYEFNYFPNESFRTAKQLLKARPTSLRLYNAYGLVESRRGNSEKADQVYCAALSMHKHTTPFITPGTLQLFHSWVWEALRRNDKVEALWRLVSPQGTVVGRPDGALSRPDQTSLLRGRTLLNEAKERALLGRDFFNAVLSVSLLAFLAYLSDDGNPDAALAVHSKLSDWFLTHALSHSPAAELHAQSIAQFLTYHATHAPIVKPTLLRDALQPLLGRFPNNTILLSVYAANEARFPIDDRVRSVMHHNVLASGSKRSDIITWLFAIYYEMRRGEIAGSTSSSIRALFLKAEDDLDAQHSPALWASHLLFELNEHAKEQEKRPPSKKQAQREEKKGRRETRLEESGRRVKETFFRGLTYLPWCKEYMMRAFVELRGFLGEEELRRVYNVMVEKELRVWVDVDVE
jgi:hypothetical protein